MDVNHVSSVAETSAVKHERNLEKVKQQVKTGGFHVNLESLAKALVSKRVLR